MNKTELKNFAVYARRDLLEKVALRAKIFGIDENNVLTIEEQFGQLVINGNIYPLSMKESFQSLANQMKSIGYDQLIEEAAYTWFNRIIAIRFMEVNDYLPEHVNILSSSTGKIEPDILTQFETMDLCIDVAEVKSLVRQGKTEQAYRKLFIDQCNALHKILPFLFEQINDYTELLLPDFLLDSESVISQLIKNVSRNNFHNIEEDKNNVEILGWLYQYYMTEKKEKVGGLKNYVVKKEDLPVVTQLFTPKWIVQYMIQNSLGKLYDEKYPNNKLSTNWKYYLKSSYDEKVFPEFDSLEELKVIDPACGSGHILLYAFDLLYEMYEEAGYPSREIPKLILENNLYGLDIDKRAQQIANFALVMKVLEKQPRFFKKNHKQSLNVIEIVDTDYSLPNEAIEFFTKDNNEKEIIKELQKIFENGKQFGSLLDIDYLEYKELIERILNFDGEKADLLEQTYIYELKDKLLPLLKQAQLLSQRYDVVCTNPPYHNKYNKILKDFMSTEKYKNYKSDLYSAFIFRATQMTKKDGYAALMTPFTWMFISSHEKLRNFIIKELSIASLIQLEYSAFEDATVPICTFVIQKQTEFPIGEYIKLSSFKGDQAIKVREAVERAVDYRYSFDSKDFNAISGSPIAYWTTKQVRHIFENYPNLEQLSEPKSGLSTTDNNRFIRYWFEVDNSNIGYKCANLTEASNTKKRWFPFNKGGGYRKWNGNEIYVVNWYKDGEEIKENAKGASGGRIVNPEYYFLEGITWSKISSGNLSVRFSGEGFIFSDAGMKLFAETDNLYYFLAILNSAITSTMIAQISSTMNFEKGNISRIPVILAENDYKLIVNISQENVKISKKDWDYFEISWDFTIHPFLMFREKNVLLSEIFNYWLEHAESQHAQLKNNEEKLNHVLINLYDLQDELSSIVTEDEITIRKANQIRDSKSFLSYFIGCVMGRYSSDNDGLVFAGGDWDDSKYKLFQPNKFGLIQLTDEHYFDNDIIERLREFLSITFGAKTVEENLQWLAESLELKRNETAEERLRRYFLDEFFKDHCQVYQKRPIYWLVDSGKQKGLRTLIYMHRYQPDTMATIRFEHLQEIQAKYNNEIAAVELRIVNPNLSATETRDLEKQKTAFHKRIEELLEFDKNLAEYANEQIALDLDNGVKVNYEKFDKVLAKIK
ncbi:BREX-1 system adenine-specific DNA-methyltransferase PglX [Paenisporosarcina sp. OV554]|uniref:BREX-1 system adenine-specific DNA-methyltransferase PglX n=1 Tax=Paenisporosarcina sp. OV554 TaxID=2135694 RepID=UPI000D36895D|nr:BREX-1 system adenine-specific DNA-methyltransferase PglX [Paenisporosarcina sp. OV554]PUB09612.1 N-6 DNA methylase [Paenisporosarcina sp. OV554]